MRRACRAMSQPFKPDDDDEDFNLFVSPSRFSGRTPSAATAKSRVFQDAARHLPRPPLPPPPTAPPVTTTNKPPRPPRLPKINTKRDANTVDIESQALVRRRVSTVNWCAAIVGFVIVVLSVPIGFEQIDSVLVVSQSSAAPLLRTPVYLAAALFVGGTAMMIYGVVLGVGAIAEALSAGVATRAQRVSLILYEVCVFLALVAFAIVLVTCTTGLMTMKGRSSVGVGIWTAVGPPERCQYQRRWRCVGVVGGKCVGGAVCAGHLCNSCRLKKGRGCNRCARLIAQKPLLDACIVMEKRGANFRGCGPVALRNLRFVLVGAVFAAVLGIVTSLAVGVVDLLAGV